MNRRWTHRWLIACALSAALTGGARGGYMLTDLGVLPGGLGSQAQGINLAGSVTGSGSTASGDQNAFRYDSSTGLMYDLVKTGAGVSSYGQAINNGGVVVGNTSAGGGPTQTFKVNAAGQYQTLGLLSGWTGSFGAGINDSNQVAGYATLAGGVTHAFVTDPVGNITDLGTFGNHSSQASGINASGMVVGSVTTPGGQTLAFLTGPKGANVQIFGGLFGGGSSSTGLAVNNAGEVVGYGGYSGGTLAFRTLPNGSLQSLGTLPGAITSSASAVNSFGQIVGTATFAGGVPEAFYFSDKTQMVPLTQVLDNTTGWDLKTATGINDFGQIVGTGVFDGATHAFLLTPDLSAVPEPSSLVLTGLGAVALAATQGKLRRGRTGDPAAGGPSGAPPAR